MATHEATQRFSERYGRMRTLAGEVREHEPALPEYALQCVWYDHLFSEDGLATEEGHRLRVISPGWWNTQEGPDFRGAQVEFNGEVFTGDVEIHTEQSGWRAHGHHLDARYDGVILHVVLHAGAGAPPITSEGRLIPTLTLDRRLDGDLRLLSELGPPEDYPYEAEASSGACAALAAEHGLEPLAQFLELAGEWRMLNKARALRQRMEHAGADQALYEDLMYACGFGRFKHHFRAIARHLPYDRVRQLAQDDPMLLEAALLQIAGLLPENLPEGTGAAPHFARLRSLRRDRLAGLKHLPLTWQRTGIRPVNNPERRLAGIARFLARTSSEGLAASLDRIWKMDFKPIERRRAFEELFPRPLGFWATHCTWTGKKMTHPVAPIGAGRVRSIIGNVFVPAALAQARRRRNRTWEENVLAFFTALPKEPDNHIIKSMLARVQPPGEKLRLNFRRQQGLIQVYHDWCYPNPSCRSCSVLRFLRPQE